MGNFTVKVSSETMHADWDKTKNLIFIYKHIFEPRVYRGRKLLFGWILKHLVKMEKMHETHERNFDILHANIM